jgi:hypothetical protein
MDHLLSSDGPILKLGFLRVKKKSGKNWKSDRCKRGDGMSLTNSNREENFDEGSPRQSKVNVKTKALNLQSDYAS